MKLRWQQPLVDLAACKCGLADEDDGLPMTFDAPPALAAPLDSEIRPSAPPLGNVAASGFKWTLAFSLFSRVLSLASFIILARLLLKTDYGAYTQAIITISLVSALRDGPLVPVLIARQKEFDRLASDGFWLSIGLGLTGAILIAIVGAVSWHHGDFTVAKLLWMNALASPLLAAGTIPAAKIQIQLRFALSAKIATANFMATTALTILLAACKWGPYALMVPQVAMGVARAACFLWLEPPKILRQIDFATIKTLLIACAIIAYTGLAIQVIGQGDNYIVSRYFEKDVVGLYGWAFNLAVQAILLLAASLGTVILPTLAMLNDEPKRQMTAFLRMSRTMAVIGIPFCALQVIFAQPLIKPLFNAEWNGTEALIRILSVGMAFAMVNGFCTQLMLARKQNRLLVIWSTVCMAAFMLLVYSGVRLGGVHGVAWGVVAYHAIVGTIGMRVAVGKHGRLIDLFNIYSPPLLAATLAAIPTLSMAWLLPRVYLGNAPLPVTLAAISVFAMLFLIVYAVTIRTLSPETWREVVQRLDGITRFFGVRIV